MANPIIVPCPKDAWTPVAIKVSSGVVHRKISGPYYLQTYRDNGDLAPTDNGEEGIPIFVDSISAIISSDSDIDVYVFVQGSDGAVRIDLPSA